jgi:hypothetical protein
MRIQRNGMLAGIATGGVLALGAVGMAFVLGGPRATPGAAPVVAEVAQGEGESRPGADPVAVELERRWWEEVEPLLGEYCYGCHAGETTKGGVGFDAIWTLEDALAMGDDLAMARVVVEGREMPPEGEPAPSDLEIGTITRWLDDALAYVPADGAVDPGWFVIHRLNRAEYRNTVRDLLGVDPAAHDVAAGLPQDDTGYGFDNIAAVHSMSPLQIEGYLEAAETALGLGLGPVVDVSDEPRALRGLAVFRGGRADGSGFMLTSNGGVGAEVVVPATADYEIAVPVWGQRAGDELPRVSVRVDGREAGAAFVEAERGDAQTVRARVRLERGRRTVSAHFTNDFYQPGVADRNLFVGRMTLAGPLSEGSIERGPAHAEVFFVSPGDAGGERAAAGAVLERFAGRAFRGPVSAAEIEGLLGLYDRSRAAGDGHAEAVRVCLSAVLVSPRFLYRESGHPSPDDPGVVHRLDGYALASRLSYFLWSSTPDDELLSLAADGSLVEDAVLRAQAARMLADPKAAAFVENFAGQWLLLRNLERLAVDRSRFPAYTPELRDAMVTEATMFFDAVLRENRSVLEFIDSDFTFVNDALAALYGFVDLAGSGEGGFRRVDLPAGSVRGGVLTMGAVLTVTSNPTRTSPVKRGLYVLDQILGTPPPPPPPDIPPLEQAAVAELGANPSLREQLKAHLTDVNCAVCHVRMDPMGLAMENFDAIGAWRDADESGPIDASGSLPSGRAFAGPEGLRAVLLEREGLFVENLTRKILTYALGRGLEPFDRPTVTRITGHARANGDRIGAMIEGVVLSDAFRSCRGVAP